MPEGRRKAIAIILTNATNKVGEAEIFKLSAMRPPQFDGISAEEFYVKSTDQVKRLQSKYRKQIEDSQKSTR